MSETCSFKIDKYIWSQHSNALLTAQTTKLSKVHKNQLYGLQCDCTLPHIVNDVHSSSSIVIVAVAIKSFAFFYFSFIIVLVIGVVVRRFACMLFIVYSIRSAFREREGSINCLSSSTRFKRIQLPF